LVGIRTYHKGRLTNTDNGRTQMLYSRVAVASYWMREIYNYDPVDISSEEFSKFKTHLEKEIELTKLHKKFNYLKIIKSFLNKKENIVKKVFSILSFLVNFYFLFWYIKFKFLGENLSKKSAVKYVKMGHGRSSATAVKD